VPGRDPLPDDVDALKRIVIGRDELIEQLTAEIHRLRRWRFGRSSEKLVPTDDQLGLALGEHEIKAANDAAEQERIPAQDSAQEPPASSRGRRSAGRRRGEVPCGVLPEHLPRETLVHEPGECTCPACGHGMRRLGEDISEQLDWVPGYFRGKRSINDVRRRRRASLVSQRGSAGMFQGSRAA
jgi:hypothetical protein